MICVLVPEEAATVRNSPSKLGQPVGPSLITLWKRARHSAHPCRGGDRDAPLPEPKRKARLGKRGLPSVGLVRSAGRSDLKLRRARIRKGSNEIWAFACRIKRRPDISAHRQTMAERLHNGRVTWFSGSGHHFGCVNQSASQTLLESAFVKVERSIKIPINASDTHRKHEPQRC